MFEPNQCYRLVDIQDTMGRSKLSECEKKAGGTKLVTSHIRFRPYRFDLKAWEMFVWFRQDLDGNSINQTILTDRIRDLYDRESSVVVETANTRYLFQKAAPPKPEFREESNLMELWLSPDGDGFCKGIHYDADGSPHVLKDWTNTGNWMKDRFLCYADDLSVTVAQYHPRVQALEWCDVYSRQHGFRTPFWIHNVSEKPMTFHLLPDDSKWEIESGGDLRIYPGTQEQQEV